MSVIDAINYSNEEKGKKARYNILGFLDDNPNALDETNINFPIIGKISEWTPIGEEVYALGVARGDIKYRLSTILKNRGCHFETLIAPWSMVSNDCKMGEGCFITLICPGTTIDDYSTTTGFTVLDNAKIGKRVFIGSHAVITSGIIIGDDAQISVGSIVTENVLPGTTVFGLPAKRID